MKTNITTLCYIEKDDCYLMLHRVKKAADINKNKWIGIGGHLEEGESPEECVVRETLEETGLQLTDYKLRGVITFVTDQIPTEYMFLYTATGYTGNMITCNEGDLEWVPITQIEQLPIWEGDKIFLRLLREGEDFFSLKLCYRGETLIEAKLNGQPC